MKSNANHSKKLFSSCECFSDARASWEELFVTRSLPIDCSSNGLVWRLQFPAQTFPSFHHSGYFHFHIVSYWKLIQVFNWYHSLLFYIFWQYICYPEINQFFSHFKNNFLEKVPCNESLHQTNVGITDYLLVFWQIFGKGSKIFWDGNLLLFTCVRGRAHDRHPVWWPLIHYYTLLFRKQKTNNEIRFKVVWVDIRQKLSNLQKTLTSFASAGISRQLLRPGPLFLKVNDITIYIWSTFCPSECWCKLVFFS